MRAYALVELGDSEAIDLFLRERTPRRRSRTRSKTSPAGPERSRSNRSSSTSETCRRTRSLEPTLSLPESERPTGAARRTRALVAAVPRPKSPRPQRASPGDNLWTLWERLNQGGRHGAAEAPHRQLGRAGVVARAEPLPDLAPTPRSTRAQGVARPDRCSHLRTRASDSGLAASGSGAAPLRQGAAPTPQSPFAAMRRNPRVR